MAHIWPIGGGKGGTGKSFISGHLGILLARQRFKTLLIDADLGAGNLHTVISLFHPERSLSDFISKKRLTLEETVLETPIPNLFLISGDRNKLDIANLPYEQKIRLFRAIPKLDYHYILIDLSAGTSFNTIDFFTLSDSGIFVCCPEPTSIENFYRLVRSVYLRKIRQILKTHDFRKLAEKAEAQNPNAVVNNPETVLEILKEIDPEKGSMIENMLQTFHFKLVLNQVRKQDNAKIGILIRKVVEKHLGLNIQFLGNVSFDERVHDVLCNGGLFIDRHPFSQTAMDLKALAKGIVRATFGDDKDPTLALPDVNTLSG
jgi:flagellar biosynthesis protein FlhG